jgi:hypothetical protein
VRTGAFLLHPSRLSIPDLSHVKSPKARLPAFCNPLVVAPISLSDDSNLSNEASQPTGWLGAV